MALSVAACGFTPVYGTQSEKAGVQAHLSDIKISNIPNREGQYLRNLLVDNFYRYGYPANPRFLLNIDPINESSADLDITKTADSTRAQLSLSTQIRLFEQGSDKELINRSLRAVTSYNILASEFATRVAEQNAREAALNDLARQIETRIALYFKRQAK